MIRQFNFKFYINNIGMLLLFMYIFMSYNACDLVIPTKWASILLYAFLACGALIAIFQMSNRSIPIHTAWYLAFVGLSMMTMLYSPEQRILGGTFYMMIVALILSYMIQLFIKDRNSFRLLCWFYAFASVVLVTTLFLTNNLVGDASNRLGGDLMGNANTFASMIMVAVIYELWLLIYGESKKLPKILLLLMILANMYTLALSAGRKFFVIPFIFLYALLFFRIDENGRRHFFKYTLLIAALVVGAYFLIMKVPVFYSAIGRRMELLLNGITASGYQGASAVIREKMRELAMQRWLKSPLWGYGFDSFKYYNRTTLSYFAYSHCNYTELLYNGGILYFMAYYWLYYRIFKNAYLQKKGALCYRAFALAVLVSYLIFEFGCVVYESTNTMIILSMALGCLNYKTEENEIVRKINGTNKNSNGTLTKAQ